MQQAIDLGCEGREFDVHMASDSTPFIHYGASIRGVSMAKSTSYQ